MVSFQNILNGMNLLNLMLLHYSSEEQRNIREFDRPFQKAFTATSLEALRMAGIVSPI
jgi:hypothetical protein